MILFIPSPPQGVWYLGPLPIRAYALSIIAGIVLGWWLSARRWRARGGTQETLDTILTWAVVAGIIGARIYHVLTDAELYFGPGRQWWRIFVIWEGGLGIWGAVAGGALVAWWRCRKAGVSFAALADVVAPGLLVAQAVGRLGNWFNQELYGRPTTVPWALEISPEHRIVGYQQYATYHPTFLYELVWCLVGAGVLLVAERRFRLGRGKLMASYVVWYTLGRFWIESLRIDTVNAVGGVRLNSYTSAIVFVGGLVLLIWLLRARPGMSPVPIEAGAPITDEAAAGAGEEPGQELVVGTAEVASADVEQSAAADDPVVAAGPEEPDIPTQS